MNRHQGLQGLFPVLSVIWVKPLSELGMRYLCLQTLEQEYQLLTPPAPISPCLELIKRYIWEFPRSFQLFLFHSPSLSILSLSKTPAPFLLVNSSLSTSSVGSIFKKNTMLKLFFPHNREIILEFDKANFADSTLESSDFPNFLICYVIPRSKTKNNATHHC